MSSIEVFLKELHSKKILCAEQISLSTQLKMGTDLAQEMYHDLFRIQF